MKFIKSDNEEVLDMLAQKSPHISKAVGVLKELSADERTRMLHEQREIARRDMVSRMEGAKREGILEGKREGILEGKREGILEGKREGILEGKREAMEAVAINMLKKNLAPQLVAEMTGLSLGHVEALSSRL